MIILLNYLYGVLVNIKTNNIFLYTLLDCSKNNGNDKRNILSSATVTFLISLGIGIYGMDYHKYIAL